MAKWLKLYATYTFSTSPNLCYRTTLLNTDVPNCYITLEFITIRLRAGASRSVNGGGDGGMHPPNILAEGCNASHVNAALLFDLRIAYIGIHYICNVNIFLQVLFRLYLTADMITSPTSKGRDTRAIWTATGPPDGAYRWTRLNGRQTAVRSGAEKRRQSRRPSGRLVCRCLNLGY